MLRHMFYAITVVLTDKEWIYWFVIVRVLSLFCLYTNANRMSCVLNVFKTCKFDDNLCDNEHSNINLIDYYSI